MSPLISCPGFVAGRPLDWRIQPEGLATRLEQGADGRCAVRRTVWSLRSRRADHADRAGPQQGLTGRTAGQILTEPSGTIYISTRSLPGEACDFSRDVIQGFRQRYLNIQIETRDYLSSGAVEHFSRNYQGAITALRRQLDAQRSSGASTTVDEALRVVGCEPHEVERLRVVGGGWLPASYEAFYRTMGKHMGLIRLGYPAEYRWAIHAAEYYAEWVEEMADCTPSWDDSRQHRFAEDVIHLGTHEGYMFYALGDHEDDPDVLELAEGKGVQRSSHRFSELVLTSISDSFHRIGAQLSLP